jgi:hypothetical protein
VEIVLLITKILSSRIYCSAVVFKINKKKKKTIGDHAGDRQARRPGGLYPAASASCPLLPLAGELECGDM